ncbi:MAG: DUF2158 domain-containing protein [Candidatus Eisenbacteria sp.]|nr:DUF2158 domain-containing protein [Candidatus Eisenbacteria bacterium]
MAEEIKAGDVVQLKSGGPRMTVEWVDKDRLTDRPVACCKWFEGKKLMGDTFELISLKRVEERDRQAGIRTM